MFIELHRRLKKVYKYKFLKIWIEDSLELNFTTKMLFSFCFFFTLSFHSSFSFFRRKFNATNSIRLEKDGHSATAED